MGLFISHPGQSFPLSLCGPISICRANAHMVYGLKHQHFKSNSITTTQLPNGLIAQLVEHCIVIAENLRVRVPFRPGFLRPFLFFFATAQLAQYNCEDH